MGGGKFYYLPFRFFELGIGGLVALFATKVKCYCSSIPIHKIATVIIISIICCSVYDIFAGKYVNDGVVIGKEFSNSNSLPISSQLALLLTVFFSSTIVLCKDGGSLILKSSMLAWFGKMSYSIFIWHQVLLAFYRYSISYNMELTTILLFLTIILIVSIGSFYLIEKNISYSHKSFVGWVLLAFIELIPSGYLYMHAGVVRDVPELDVLKGAEHRGMFGEYCDRVYKYKEFPKIDNGKPNVLVADISFGRDFANVLLESEYADRINLVYLYVWSDTQAENLVKQSDYIFTFTSKTKLPEFVWNSKKADCKVMGISTKNYGSCNGIIYKKRNSKDYFKQVATIDPGYKELNEEWKKQWGDDYIDLLTLSLIDDTHVKVFTDNNKYISQDCRHLTQAGAQWYARILDWDHIFMKN